MEVDKGAPSRFVASMEPREPARHPVLVTGATGFFGGHLAAALARRGFPVRALARPTSSPAAVAALERLGVSVARGDVLDAPSLDAAMAGQAWVLNAAGRVSDWGSLEAFERANVVGTRAVVAACQRAGVTRLVHWSSLTVLGLPRDGRTVDEGSPAPELPAWDFYSRTKRAGEALVREAHGQRGLETTVIRPGAIWGPGDPVIMPRIARLLRRGLVPYIDGGRNALGLSYVDNLVEGTLLAAASPAARGQLYHLTDGELVTARDAVDGLADALSLPRPRVSVPFAAVYALAATIEQAARAVGSARPPPLTRYGARFMACDCRYDIGKARRELGYAPAVGLREGLARVAESLRGP